MLPLSMCRMTLFPAPLLPMRPTISPVLRVVLKSLRTTLPLNFLLTCSIVISSTDLDMVGRYGSKI